MKEYIIKIKDWFVFTIKIIIGAIIASLLLNMNTLDCIRLVMVMYLIIIGVLLVVTKIVNDFEE